MKSILNIGEVIFVYVVALAFFFVFLSQYFYPHFLEFSVLSSGNIQLIIMALGALSIALLSFKKLGLGWKIFAVALSLLIILESFFMTYYVN